VFGVPGTAEVTPSVLVRDRSARGVRVSVSVSVLSAGSGSVTPGGGGTVAVLARLPVADGSIRTVKVKVPLAPTGRLTVAARAPLPPDGPLTLPPPVWPANAQVAARTPAGRGSATLAPLTALGPWLLTTRV